MNQDEHDWDFHKRPDDGGEGACGPKAEEGDGDRQGELKVVAGRREGDGGALLVRALEEESHEEAAEEHDEKIESKV